MQQTSSATRSLRFQNPQSFLNAHKATLLRIAALTAVFVTAWFWTWEGPGLCSFHRLTGLDCPGCGMTRAFHQLSHGNLAEALEFNLLSPVVFFSFLLVLLLDVFQFATGLRINFSKLRGVMWWGGWVGFVVVLGYGVLRNITDIP